MHMLWHRIASAVIHRMHDNRKSHIRKYSYLQPILQSLRKYDYPEIRVILDEAEKPRTGRMALPANLPMYAMHLPIARSAVGDDGLFDLRLSEGIGIPNYSIHL